MFVFQIPLRPLNAARAMSQRSLGTADPLEYHCWFRFSRAAIHVSEETHATGLKRWALMPEKPSHRSSTCWLLRRMETCAIWRGQPLRALGNETPSSARTKQGLYDKCTGPGMTCEGGGASDAWPAIPSPFPVTTSTTRCILGEPARKAPPCPAAQACPTYPAVIQGVSTGYPSRARCRKGFERKAISAKSGGIVHIPQMTERATFAIAAAPRIFILAPGFLPGYNPLDVECTRNRSLRATQGVQTG